MNQNDNQDIIPPISKNDYENDTRELSRAEFIVQYSKSSGSPEEAEEMADSIYGKK